MRDHELKLKELKDKIENAKLQNQNKNKANPSSSQMGKVLRLAVEIVAAMAVGLGLGLLLDNYLETKPIFTIIFFLLGSCAGFLNIFRVAKSL